MNEWIHWWMDEWINRCEFNQRMNKNSIITWQSHAILQLLILAYLFLGWFHGSWEAWWARLGDLVPKTSYCSENKWSELAWRALVYSGSWDIKMGSLSSGGVRVENSVFLCTFWEIVTWMDEWRMDEWWMGKWGEWMNGWMNEWMNGWMDEWMNGWMGE